MIKHINQLMWIVTLVSIVGVILNIKKRRECFVIWGVTNSLWSIYDFSIHAYAQSFLFFIYVLLAIWGIWEWRSKKGEKLDE